MQCKFVTNMVFLHLMLFDDQKLTVSHTKIMLIANPSDDDK